jgi:hypothetical protein
MSKFVVTETLFQYNDEGHDIAEDEAGLPVAVFEDRQSAVDYARNRTIDSFLLGYYGEQLEGFGAEISSIFKEMPSFVSMDPDDFFFGEEYFDLDVIINIKNRSREQLEEIADCLAFSPFKITEVYDVCSS